MITLNRLIERRVEGAVERWLDARLPGMVDDIMRKEARRNLTLRGPLNSTQFVWQMAFEFMRTDRSMAAVVARDLAVETLRQFLRDEKIRFGHRDYGWDQGCAVTLARECEIDHWEAAA